MIGAKFSEFINSLYNCPEIEHKFRDKTYMLQFWRNDDASYSVTLWICGIQKTIFEKNYQTLRECIEYYKQAKCYEGLTIYQAEKEIEINWW